MDNEKRNKRTKNKEPKKKDILINDKFNYKNFENRKKISYKNKMITNKKNMACKKIKESEHKYKRIKKINLKQNKNIELRKANVIECKDGIKTQRMNDNNSINKKVILVSSEKLNNGRHFCLNNKKRKFKENIKEDEKKSNNNEYQVEKNVKDKKIKKVKLNFSTFEVSKDFDHFSSLEQEILKNGTKRDKINLLSLMITRHPDNAKKELNLLLDLSYNERPDTVFVILKIMKDILLNNFNLDNYDQEKERFINIINYNLQNIHIKHKVIDLVFTMLKNNVLFSDLIGFLINKIGDKKHISVKVINIVKELYKKKINNDAITFAIKKLYLKDIKARKKITDLLKVLDYSNINGLCKMFYDNLNRDDFTDENEYENILNNLVLGFVTEKYELDQFDESKLLFNFKIEDLNINILQLLYNLKNKKFVRQLLSVIKKGKIEKRQKDLLNLIYNFLNGDSMNSDMEKVILYFLQHSMFFDNLLLSGFLIILNEIIKKTKIKNSEILFLIEILSKHYHPVIKYLSQNILDDKPSSFIDVYNQNEFARLVLLSA